MKEGEYAIFWVRVGSGFSLKESSPALQSGYGPVAVGSSKAVVGLRGSREYFLFRVARGSGACPVPVQTASIDPASKLFANVRQLDAESRQSAALILFLEPEAGSSCRSISG